MTFLPELKSRREPTESPHSFETRPNGLSTNWTKTTNQGWVDESILTQCHTGVWPPPLNSDRDVGGAMSLQRVWSSYPEVSTISAHLCRGVIGMSQMIGYVYGQAPAGAGSINELNTFGTSAIARVLPTNPNSSLSTALGELKKDGLPSIPGLGMRDRADLARKSGSEFLNIEFGWLPLLNDIREFADSVRRSRQLIDQFVRDSGRKIRRRYVPQPITLQSSVFTGTGRTDGNIFCPNSTVTKTTELRFWFSGAFKYHVPIDDGFYGRLLRYESFANRLFDSRLTPELLWNLAPWSWAVDWFTNTGDVIHNISRLGSDGLVMQYGYAMRHMRVNELHRGSYHFTDTKGTHSGTVARSIGSEWKQRIAANPYGFGIDDTSLNAVQLAILAALGLTRGQRSGQ